MNPNEITSGHKSRSAYVYIRQSTQHQVMHHQESQRRQRSLQERAVDLGWSCDLIKIIDEDLAQSGARSQGRTGFQKMVAEAALGNIGIILALEVSRVSRNNRDWYHLLDICAVTGTMLADGEGLYDPRSYNDRLILGLKGTMSEAELHVMKQRLVEAMLAKAKRGEFRFRLSPGYEWDEEGRLVKVADEQVRSCIERIFARFEQWGTMHRVRSSMADDGIKVPIISGRRQRIRWGSPDYAHLRRILTNPIYAGAYCYGKRQVEQYLDSEQRPLKRVRERPRQQWHVLIRDHHESYISWERFERIQRQIELNRRRPAGPGAPREGWALLQGLVYCGQCGRRMRLTYNNGGTLLRYCCVVKRQQTGQPVCQDFGGRMLERAVEELALEAIQPLGIEAMIEAAASHARACEGERVHWRQQAERAVYEVDIARRQYDAVDPSNRLVARELERRFEKALQEQREIEQKVRIQIEALDQPLTEEEQRMLRDYSDDLRKLWHEPTTRSQERKRIIRC